MSKLEDDYFAREEIEAKRRISLDQSQKLAERSREDLRTLHHMHCPSCGMDLQTLQRGQVAVDMCFHCKGIWLDQGKLEKLLAQGQHQGGAVMGAVLNIFKND